MTNVNLTAPNHITSLQTSAILINLDTATWSSTIGNTRASDDIAATNKASRKAVKVIEDILAGHPSYKKIIASRSAIYNWIKSVTFDWSGSYRLLPVIRLPTFMAEYTEKRNSFFGLVDSFVVEYPSIISDMAFERGEFFKREDYPDPAYVRGSFRIDLYQCEVPSGDFRVQVAQELVDDLTNHFNRQAQQWADGFVKEQTGQLVSLLNSLSKGCDSTVEVDADGSRKVVRGRVFKSTFEKAIAWCDTLASFNPTSNVELEDARRILEDSLRGLDVENLRDSDIVREQVKASVSTILDKFKAFEF
jgi:hypothetical protein